MKVLIYWDKRFLTDVAAYDAMAKVSNPYGDEKACERIAKILTNTRIKRQSQF